MLAAPHGPVRVIQALSTAIIGLHHGLIISSSARFFKGGMGKPCVRVDLVKAVLGFELDTAFYVSSRRACGRGLAPARRGSLLEIYAG